MSAELEVLKTVTGRLEAGGIAYMVTGSMALNYYAMPRMTRDIDVVVEVSAVDAERIVGLFSGDFYIEPDVVRRAIEARGTFNAIHSAEVVKVDFVVRKEGDYRRAEFVRRRRVSVVGHEFSIVAPEDLIISKLDWARGSRSDVQLRDARSLLESVVELDRQYLSRWIARLGLDDLYREVGG